LFQYELFVGWDGKFLPNVVLQAKNGPYDFQVREPVHALFGRMPKTNFILELQATQEYLGQAKHLAHLPAQWDYYLSWDTGFLDKDGKSQTLGQYVSGTATGQSFTGMAAVSNLGRDANWAGHEMSAANTYGFGRLAWNPALHARSVTEEWVRATWGVDSQAVAAISNMLLESWETYENYTSPLGAGFICSSAHYGMDPGHRKGVWLLNATKTAIGNERWKGYAQKYLEPMVSKLGSQSPDDCPEELLLSFHNVPYDYKLKSKGGVSVIQYIYESHHSGARKAATWPAVWQSLEGKAVEGAFGAGVFETVAERLRHGAVEAATFANTVIGWFKKETGIPGPGPVPTPTPSPSPPVPKGYQKSSGHCWKTTGQNATRVSDDKHISLETCMAQCDADDKCYNFDYLRKEMKCRIYNGRPMLTGSSLGYDAYAKTAGLIVI
jgi:alpha-glucuronidase